MGVSDLVKQREVYPLVEKSLVLCRRQTTVPSED
jgi:hypothetical protein